MCHIFVRVCCSLLHLVCFLKKCSLSYLWQRVGFQKESCFPFPSSQGVVQNTMGNGHRPDTCWLHFLFDIQFPGAIIYDRVVFCVCARGLLRLSWECRWYESWRMSSETFAFEPQSTHYVHVWLSGAEFNDRWAWRDCVKCHTAREDSQMVTIWWHFLGHRE